MDTLIGHLKQVVRSFVARPGLMALVVLPLGLGIGMNTAIFSAVHAVLLKSLPYEEPDRLVRVWEARPRMGPDAERVGAFSLAHFRAWRDDNEVFEAMALYGPVNFNLTGAEEPRRITGQNVSVAFFPILGVEPIHGRYFAEEEEIPGRDRVVVLSYTLWRNTFGAEPSVIGEAVSLDGNSYTVVGVMPPAFRFPDAATELWVPRPLPPPVPSRPGEVRIELSPVVARLAPGVSLEAAESAGDAFLRNYREGSELARRMDEGVTIRLTSLRDRIVQPIRPALQALLVAVGLVLLIVCANVANLLLVRAQGREREIAVRAALGASRSRLLGKLLTESVVLGLVGALVGVGVAYGGVRLIEILKPPDVPLLDDVSIDTTVLGFNLVVALLTAVVVGLFPAIRGANVDVVQGLKGATSSGRDSLLSPTPRRFRTVLAVAEVGLALVLFVTAGLFMRSFLTLSAVDPGYEPQDVLTFRLDLPRSKYPDGASRKAFFDQLRETLDEVPGATAAGLTNVLPLDRARFMTSVQVEGRPRPTDPQDIPHATLRVVSPGYFQAMGIPLRSGRSLASGDGPGAPRVVVINEAFAERNFENDEPLGQRLAGFGEIIGVVADVRQEGLESDPEPELFLDYRQIQGPFEEVLASMSVAVRHDPDKPGLVLAARMGLQRVDPELPLADVRLMEDRLLDSVARPRLYAVLLGVFATLGLVLAVSGVYSVISYSVAQRARETGIRMALGATERQVVRSVLADGLRILGFGIGLGLAASLLLARSLSSLLFAIEPVDPATYAVVAALLGAAVLVASAIPARQAARLDPVRALRYE